MEIDRLRVSEEICPAVSSSAAGQSPESNGGHTCNGKAGLKPRGAEEARIGEFVREAEQCRQHLIRVAKRMIVRDEDAEDIVQQALLKAFVNLSRFRGESQMTTWLQAIVRNAALEYLRNQRGRVLVPLECGPFPDGYIEELDLPDTGMNPEEHYESCETKEIVSSAIRGMVPDNRRVFEMCVLDGLPHLEVAAVLNISLSTVKSRIFRSRRHLKQTISVILARSGDAPL